MAKFGFKFESEFLKKDSYGVIYGITPLFGGDTDSALQLGANAHAWSDGALIFDRANVSGLRANADNIPKLIRTQFLPNGAQGQNPSGGWTCTGLFKLANGNWLVGNGGRSVDTDTIYAPSLIELSFDCQTIINEFDMSSFVGNNSVQGVIQANDGSYWVTAPNNNTIHNIDSATGAEISSFAATSANGLAYDSVNNNLIWCAYSSSTFHVYSLDTGTEIATKTLELNSDQLHYKDGALFITKDVGGGNGKIVIYDYINERKIGELKNLPACESIEGIHVSNNSITIANDGGIKPTSYPNRSMFLTYKFNNVYPSKTRFVGVHGKLTLDGAAPSDRGTLIACGKPYSSGGGYGWAVFFMGSDELRIQIRNNADGALYLAEYAITRGVVFTFDVYVDLDGATVYCEIDGVDQGAPVTTAGAIANIISDINMTYTTIGVSQEANPNEFPLNASVKNVFTTTTLTDFNAVKAINQGQEVASTISMSITGLPDGDYTVEFTNPSTGELVDLQEQITFTSGSATSNAIAVLAGTTLEYTIRTATHVMGDSGVTA